MNEYNIITTFGVDELDKSAVSSKSSRYNLVLPKYQYNDLFKSKPIGFTFNLFHILGLKEILS